MTTVISHLSALRAIRRARRAYSALPWDAIDDEQQTQALVGCVPNKDAIDFAALAILDAWSEDDSERLDLFVASGSNRRPDGRLLQHTITAPLPQAAIMHIEADIYATSPAMTAMLCSKNESVAKTLMLLMELLGTYSLPPEATYPIAYDDTWPEANSFETMDDLDCQGDQPTPEKQSETRYEQAHYKCEPATTIEELEAVARFAKSSSYASFRTAIKLARAGSASPAESLMFAVLGAPMRFGGFGCCSLPMGGLLLNYRVDFDTLAINMSSGIPYAICDLYCPAAGVDNEYNGIGHELQNARIHDGNRNNGLKAMGIHVLVINRDQMKDLVALEAFAQTMHRLAGVRFRYRIKGYRKRQAAWLNTLRAGIGLAPV
ncbi:MAG: endonuclease domain-containing protein [Collinsella sp.]|nr:endonuclease domain-containing protein [Collinsella sp.]MDY3259536.1 hypothetical protein [Collinsella sp.]